MLRFAKLAAHPRRFARMTGLTLDQFQTLTNRLTPLWEQAECTRLSQRPRQHAIGQGRKYKLATMADELLALLVFYRFYLTDELLGWLVGLDASTGCRQSWSRYWSRRLIPRWGCPSGVGSRPARRRSAPGRSASTATRSSPRSSRMPPSSPVVGPRAAPNAASTPVSASAIRSRPN